MREAPARLRSDLGTGDINSGNQFLHRGFIWEPAFQQSLSDAQLGEILLTSAAPSAGSNQWVNHKVPVPISFMSDEEKVWDNSSL